MRPWSLIEGSESQAIQELAKVGRTLTIESQLSRLGVTMKRVICLPCFVSFQCKREWNETIKANTNGMTVPKLNCGVSCRSFLCAVC